jgi:hypothetical protein
MSDAQAISAYLHTKQKLKLFLMQSKNTVTKKCIYRWHAIGRVPTDQLAIVLFIANASGLRIDLYDYLVEEEADDSCRAVAA